MKWKNSNAISITKMGRGGNFSHNLTAFSLLAALSKAEAK
jgi:hypothetical protein